MKNGANGFCHHNVFRTTHGAMNGTAAKPTVISGRTHARRRIQITQTPASSRAGNSVYFNPYAHPPKTPVSTSNPRAPGSSSIRRKIRNRVTQMHAAAMSLYALIPSIPTTGERNSSPAAVTPTPGIP